MMKHPYDLLDLEERCFDATKNPMHAWAAFSIARTADVPVPNWVMRYFDTVARGMMAVASEAREDGGSDPGPRFAKALRINGKQLTGYHNDDLVMALHVASRIKLGDGPDAAVFGAAEAYRVSESTAYRAFQKYKNQIFDADILRLI